MMIFKERLPLLIFIPSILLILAVGLAKVLFDAPVYHLVTDIFVLADIHPLSGLLSNIGILLWCATATVCFFAAGFLRQTKNYKAVHFCLASACLSTYLLIDDFFLLHDEIAPIYMGIPENVILLLVAIAVIVYLVCFRRIILRSQYKFMLIAVGFLGLSLGIDTILKPWFLFLGEWEGLLEDGAKLIGIASWCCYYTDMAYQFLLDKSCELRQVQDLS